MGIFNEFLKWAFLNECVGGRHILSIGSIRVSFHTLKYRLALQKQTAKNYISHTPLKLVNAVPAIRRICVNLIR